MGVPKIYTLEFIEKEADALEEWLQKDDSFFFNQFVLTRRYGPQYISVFCNESEKFAEVCARAKAMQELKLMAGGLTRKYDSSFCKFTMQNVCKWSDKQTVVHENNTQAIDPAANNTSKDLVNDKSN